MSLKLLLSGLAGSLLLSACSVYAPTVPATPLLTQGQVQVSAGLRGLNSLELGAAWAPTRHLLLSAESGFQSSTTTTTINNVTASYDDFHRQVSLGAGYYRAAPSGWYLAALGGAGYASTQLHSVDVGLLYILPIPIISGQYEARYFRYYGQVYAALPAQGVATLGFSLRNTYVDYMRLALDGTSVEPAAHFFAEPSLFVKLGTGPVQALGTVGLSLPWHRDAGSPFASETAPTSSLVGLTLLFRPDLLRGRHQQ